MTRPRSVTGIVVAVAISLAACSGGGDDIADRKDEEPVESSSTSTTVPAFDGDVSVPFCEALMAFASRPVLDPFAGGIDPTEVELRLRNLVVRWEELSAASPPELADDVAAITSGLRALDDALDAHGHDLGAAASAGVDTSVFDDPRYADHAARIDAYRDQLCPSEDSGS